MESGFRPRKKWTRRDFLQRSGVLGLNSQFLQFLFPGSVIGLGALSAEDEARAQGRHPMANNLITFSFPNGCQPEWWNFNHALAPLNSRKQQVTVLQGLTNPSSSFGDGHEQGGVTLFTGGAFKRGEAIEGTQESLDQIISKNLDSQTLLQNPLVTGVWRGFAGGEYRNPRWFRRSWRQGSDGRIRPVAPLLDPQQIFTRLVGQQAYAGQESVLRARKSVLDAVMEHYKAFLGENSLMGKEAKEDLSVHFEHIRDIEQKIQREAELSASLQQCQSSIARPNSEAVPGRLDYSKFEHFFNIQMDLTVLALKCGLTHTASLMFGCAGEEYVNSGVARKPCHTLSHWGNDDERRDYIKFRHFYMTRLAGLLDRLGATPGPGGKSLFDSTLVIMGTEFGESTKHIRNPQPLLLAGGAGFKMGQVLNFAENQTTNDLYRSVLQRFGINKNAVGDPAHNSRVLTEIFG